MRKQFLIAIVFLATISISCSSDSEDGPMNPPPPQGNDVTYTAEHRMS